MGKFVVEILKEVNENPELLAQYTTNNALLVSMQYAFRKDQKFNLPEGDPPFKPDANPLGMSPANYQQEVRRFGIFVRSDEQLPRLRRETLFIQLLEGLHPSESALLLAIKDQNLTKLYPNITAELLVKHGFLDPTKYELAVAATPKSEVKDEVESGTKRGRGRPTGAKNKKGTKDQPV